VESKHIVTKQRNLYWLAVAAAVALALAACGQEGPAEKVGQSIDKSAEQAGRTLDQAKDAVVGKAGEAAKSIDDAALAARVKAALVAEPSVDSLKIDVESKNGVVSLEGTVQQPAERAKIEQIALAVEGVKAVNNNVAVSGS